MQKTKERASEAVFGNDHNVALIRAGSNEENQVRVSYFHQGGDFPLELFDWVFGLLLLLDLEP